MPRGGQRFPSRLTEDETLTVPCTTCGAEITEPCDFSYHSTRVLGIFVKDAPRTHSARYALGLRMTDARKRRAEKAAA
jgi:hypothetical protein